jgi:hypothetical protein
MRCELPIAVEHARHALDGAAIHTAHVEGVFRDGRQQADGVLPELMVGGWGVLHVHDIDPVLVLGFAHPPPWALDGLTLVSKRQSDVGAGILGDPAGP